MSKADVWIAKRRGKKRMHYALRWIDPDTGKLCCKSVGMDAKLAAKLARIKVDELREGILKEPDAVPWSQFVTEEVEHIAARHSAAYVVIMQTALETFGTTCSPASPLNVTPAMVEAYVTNRMKGSRRCRTRTCAVSNPVNQTTCYKCGGSLTARVQPVSPSTIGKNARALHVAFEHARKRYGLRVNPFADAELPKAKTVVKPALTLDEQTRALEACPNVTWRAYLYLGLTTGLRRGDLAAVQWEQINLDAGTMNVIEHKTGEHRTVDLSPKAVAMLREVRLIHAGPEVFIHRGKRGRRVDFYAAVGKMMDRIVQAAGIPRFTFHATRRTLATDLAAAGVNQVVASAMIGHKSLSTTARYYTAVNQSTKRSAQQSLPIERFGT